jgi:hypothetical protein
MSSQVAAKAETLLHKSAEDERVRQWSQAPANPDRAVVLEAIHLLRLHIEARIMALSNTP